MHGVDPDDAPVRLNQLQGVGQLALGSSDFESQTGRPGVFSPSMAPGFGQCAVSAEPSSSMTSAKKRL
jgi:hypothetical protein